MSARKLSQRLPKKMSSLLLLALKDLERTEKDPRYEINMGTWHQPSPVFLSGVCSVCLAGSVLAQRFLDRDEDFRATCSIRQNVRGKMIALNSLRVGAVSQAAERLGIPHNYNVDATNNPCDFDRSITAYEDQPKRFKRQLTKLALDLRKAGL